MEATHLGAWMAGRSAKEVDDALSILEVAPTFRDEGWLRTAFEVIEKYPKAPDGYQLLSGPIVIRWCGCCSVSFSVTEEDTPFRMMSALEEAMAGSLRA